MELIRGLLFGLMQGGAEFTVLDQPGASKYEIIKLLRTQRIPIRTWGWRREVVTVEAQAPIDARAGETRRSRELHEQYEQPDLDTGVSGADYSTPQTKPGKQGVLCWSFYCLRTQAFYAEQALLRNEVRILKSPRAANKPRGRSPLDDIMRPPRAPSKSRRRNRGKFFRY